MHLLCFVLTVFNSFHSKRNGKQYPNSLFHSIGKGEGFNIYGGPEGTCFKLKSANKKVAAN